MMAVADTLAYIWLCGVPLVFVALIAWHRHVSPLAVEGAVGKAVWCALAWPLVVALAFIYGPYILAANLLEKSTHE